MANTYKKPKRAINVVTIKGYSTSAEDMPNDPKASNAYRAFQAHETVEIKTSDTETFLIPFHAIAEFQSFLDTTALTKKDPYCDDESGDGDAIKMNITYEADGQGGYTIHGSTPQTGSVTLESGSEYTITIKSLYMAEPFVINGVAEEGVIAGETGIIVEGFNGTMTIGVVNGEWVFEASAQEDNEIGDSIIITITEGDGGGDTPKQL